MNVSREQRGLLVPAWTGGANYNGAKVVFAEGEYAGMTVSEVARQLRVRPETVREMAIKGACPSQLERENHGRGHRETAGEQIE